MVASPGQAAEEFALNTVPDNAIQIVDDEPQGVPTEEEVDAMLAATATALLTSSLAARSRPATTWWCRQLGDRSMSRRPTSLPSAQSRPSQVELVAEAHAASEVEALPESS